MAALSVRAQRTAYSFDDNLVTIPVNNPSERSVYKLKRDKLEIIPVQRMVGNQLLLEMPKSNELATGQEVEAGYYELYELAWQNGTAAGVQSWQSGIGHGFLFGR